MMKTHTILPALILSAAACLSQASAATYVYDFATQVGTTNGTLISTDNWTGTGVADWKIADGGGLTDYASNTADTNRITTRANDANFTYSILPTDTHLTLETTVRVSGSKNWTIALANGANVLIGVGGNFGDGDAYIIRGGSRYFETGTGTSTGPGPGSFASAGVFDVRLELDLLANSGNGSGDLYVNNVKVMDGRNLGLGSTDMTTANGLYMRSNHSSVGVDGLTITTVPEPSSTALLGLGGLALILRRRK